MKISITLSEEKGDQLGSASVFIQKPGNQDFDYFVEGKGVSIEHLAHSLLEDIVKERLCFKEYPLNPEESEG